MHEAGIAARAIEDAVASAAATGRRSDGPVGLDVVIDPARVTADALALHLELGLRERGLGGLPVSFATVEATCPVCGVTAGPDAWVLCEACGAPRTTGDGPPATASFRY